MVILIFILLTLIFFITIGRLVYSRYKRKPLSPPNFYSINDGNQNEIIFGIDYNKVWFEEIDNKYSWESFDVYNNRYWEYIINLSEIHFEIANDNYKSREKILNNFTRGQKIIYIFSVFNQETDNGGVYQFFFNKPELCFATLETFKELRLDNLSKDYEDCLNEFCGSVDSYIKRKTIFNDSISSWDEKWKTFTEGYNDIKSGKKIEDYYYKVEFKKQLYKTVVNYIDNNINQFVKSQ